MAEAQTDQGQNQEGATPNPEAAPKLKPARSSDNKREPVSERDYLANRRKERAERRAAIQGLQESPQPKSEGEQEVTSDPNREEAPQVEAEGSKSAEVQTATEPQEGLEATPDGEGYFPETLTELAEALGVESGDFMQGMTANVTVNGETTSVPLNDLLSSYSSASERNRAGQALAEERKAFDAQIQQQQAEYQSRIQQADAMLDTLKASIDMGPDDATLSQMLTAGQIDERQYLTAKANLDAKKAQFNEIVEKRNEAVKVEHEKFQEAQKTARSQEEQALLAWKPELNDPAKLGEFQTRFRGGLTQHYGLSDDQVNAFFQTYSLPQVQIVNDALAYRELQAKEKPIRQKLHTLPKLQRPGPKRSAGQKANDEVLGARSRLKSSGTAADAVALLRAKRAQRNRTHGGSQ